MRARRTLGGGVSVPFGKGLGTISIDSKYGSCVLCSSLMVFLPAASGKMPVTDQPPASGEAS